MEIPAWLIVFCPLAGLLAILTIVWWFVRRGIGPVHRAASFGDVEKLRAHLTACPDAVNRCDAFGLTPLQYAACWRQTPAAKLLIERGADVNMAKNWSPLHYAAAAGQKPLAEALLSAGANVGIHSSADHTTPLHVAVVNKQPAMVAFLIEHGADLDSSTRSGWTACHFAAHDGDGETVRILLDAGADWQAKNADDKSPSQLALAAGRHDILNLVSRREGVPNERESDITG